MTTKTLIEEQLANIEWFVNCGKPFDTLLVMEVMTVSSWQEASTFYHEPAWEWTTMEARNALTAHLSFRYQTRYQEWNAITKSYKQFLKTSVFPKIIVFQEHLGLDKKFVNRVEWDVLAAMMEETYRDCKLPTTFYRELLRVYQAGHFPCGWVGGEWPTGKLVVF